MTDQELLNYLQTTADQLIEISQHPKYMKLCQIAKKQSKTSLGDALDAVLVAIKIVDGGLETMPLPTTEKLISNGKGEIIRVFYHHPKYIANNERNTLTKTIYAKAQAINEAYQEDTTDLERIKAIASSMHECFDVVRNKPNEVIRRSILLASLGILDPANPINRIDKDAVQAIIDGLGGWD